MSKRTASQIGLEDERSAKKHKAIKSAKKMEKNNPFNLLSNDIIQDILVHRYLGEMGNMSRVCRRWADVIRRQDFWKALVTSYYGKNIVPLRALSKFGEILPGASQYLLPTIPHGNQKKIDWLKYFKLRLRLDYFLDAFALFFDRNIEDDYSDSDADSEIIMLDDDELEAFEFIEEDLIIENLKYWIQRAIDTQLGNFFPNRLLRVYTSLALEMIPVLIQENQISLLEMVVNVFFKTTSFFSCWQYSKRKKEKITYQLLDILQLLHKQPSVKARTEMTAFCRTSCQDVLEFNKIESSFANDIFMKTLQEIAETKNFRYQNGSKNNTLDIFASTNTLTNSENMNDSSIHNEKDPYFNMLYLMPHSRILPLVPSKESWRSRIENAEEVFNALHKFIYTRYFDTKDLNMKRCIIELYQDSANLYASANEQMIEIAIDAAKKYKKNANLSFAGYSLIMRMLQEKLIRGISNDILLQICNVLSDGIARFSDNGLFCLRAINQLIIENKVNNSIIDDQQFDLLNKNVLALLQQPQQVFSSELSQSFWNGNYSNLSIPFGNRMNKYLPLYKEAILHLARSDLRIDTNTGIPFVTRAQILAFYYRLVINSTPETRVENAVKESVEFTKAVVDNSFGLPLTEEDIAEFSAHACTPIYYGLENDHGKATNFLRTLLKNFDPEILAYGASFSKDNCNYESASPNYIPNNMKEFKESIQKFNEKKKSSWFQNRSELIQKCFNFEDSWEYLMEDFDDNSEFEADPDDAPQQLQKYSPTNVNPNRRHEGIYYTTARQLCSVPHHTNIITLLAEIFEKKDAEKFLEFAQPTLHIILAHIRANGSFQYCRAIINLYNLLEPQLILVDQRYYFELFMDAIFKQRKRMTREDLEPCQIIQEKVLQGIEKYSESNPSLICYQLLTATFYAHKTDYSAKSRLVYRTWKRVLAASPRKTYAVVVRSQFIDRLKILDNLEEQVMIFASIGYHFGVGCLTAKARPVALEYKCNHVLQKAKNDSEADKEEIELLERFLILHEVARLDTQTRDLCLFNAPFSEHENSFLRAIRHEEFDLGDELNARAKEFNSLVEFFNLSTANLSNDQTDSRSWCVIS